MPPRCARSKPRRALLAALLAVACGGRDEARRDAWALWLAHEPSCLELSGEKRRQPPSAGTPRQPPPTELGAALSPRWRRALGALAGETLAAMEERLAAADAGRGASGRPLVDLVAASRRLCALAPLEATPGASPALAEAAAELAAARARLAILLPLDAAEVRRRSAPYDQRLSAAVSRALERGAADSGPAAGPTVSPGSAADAAAARRPAPRSRPHNGGGDRRQEGAGARPDSGILSIRPSSGESWSTVRRRREEEAARRLASWEPRYRSGLRPLSALRAELAAGFERESLAGLGPLCARLGGAAERVPREVVSRAPTPGLAADLEALLVAYAAAGRACRAGRPVEAWSRLTAGDRHWRAAEKTLARLAAGPPLPDSLRRRAAGGNLPPAATVD